MKLGQLIDITCEAFFCENNTQNAVEKLFPDTFLKNEKCAYFWLNSRKYFTVCFYFMASEGPSKCVETKL